MKKLFNAPETMVDDMVDGFVAAYPQVERGTLDPRIVVRAGARKDADRKVTLLIGNGAGHEPIAMGFVGAGLLDANVGGGVFAAPAAERILDGLQGPPTPERRVAVNAWLWFMDGAIVDWLEHRDLDRAALRALLLRALEGALGEPL